MNLTLDYLKSNRKWLVPKLVVWGNADTCRANLLMTEIGTQSRVVFAANNIGGKNQDINYTDLVDSQGNTLPEQITGSVVIIIPRNRVHCFLIGRPTKSGFKIGRRDMDSGYTDDGLVDLLILEVDVP